MTGKIFVLHILFFIISTLKHNECQKIVGGNETEIADIPYQVAVVIINSLCGGCIIAEEWVLTAAHCVYNTTPQSITVHAGSNVWYGGIRYIVDRVFRHQEYNPDTYENDVALLLLTYPIQYNSVVFPRQPIALATSLPSDNTSVLVSGYGTTSSDGNLSPRLMSVNVDMVNVNQCNISYTGGILNGMFCAAQLNKDSCQGDSGGPIVHNKELIGMVSWGYGCADSRYPGVYTSVPYFYDWIVNIYTATNNKVA